ARALCDAAGQDRRRREGGLGERAGVGAFGAQVFVYAQRRLRLDARAQGRARPRHGSRDGVQLERLCRAALGRTRQQRRGVDVQAARAVGAAREDDGLPRLVPRAAPAAARLAAAELVINLTTAKALGPAIPGSLLHALTR